MKKTTLAGILITLIIGGTAVTLKVKEGDTVKVDDSGNVTVTDVKSVNIDDYKLPSETDYYNAWRNAKDALPDGGIILFKEGTYSIDTAISGAGWFLEKSDITLQGAGMDKTFLTSGGNTTVTMSNATRLHSSYVKGFYIADTAHAFTYKNTLTKGSDYIVLKNNAWLDSINVGDKVMLTGGSHYFDQEFGELNTVKSKNDSAVFFEEPLSGSYQVDSVPYGNEILDSLIMPEIGQTVTATIQGRYLPILIGRMLNIGDNIFGVKSYSVTDRTITFINVGRGNSPAGTVIPASTHIMKPRTILLWNHTQNLTINDLTITGNTERVLRLDNTYGAELNNVRVTRASAIRDGYVYTIDFSKKIKASNCIFESLIAGSASQVSRSSGYISFFKSRFINTKNDVSEYSYKVDYDSCIFDIGLWGYSFIMGATVRKSSITNCIFNVDSSNGIIQASEIQDLVNIQREYCLIKNNTFNINRYATGIVDLSVFGTSYFTNNTIKGEGRLFNFSGSLNRRETGVGLYPCFNYIDSNSISVRFVRAFSVGGLYSGTISNNIIKNTDPKKVTVFLNYSSGVKGALISNNIFEGFTSPIFITTNVMLLNNVIK